MTSVVFIDCDAKTLVGQIGMGYVLAISGGRVLGRRTGITLPVSNGYSVKIDLAADDTYTVERVFRRSGREWSKGVVHGVYCEEVSEVAHRASCFRNVEFGGKS